MHDNNGILERIERRQLTLLLLAEHAAHRLDTFLRLLGDNHGEVMAKIEDVVAEQQALAAAIAAVETELGNVATALNTEIQEIQDTITNIQNGDLTGLDPVVVALRQSAQRLGAVASQLQATQQQVTNIVPTPPPPPPPTP